MKHEMLDLRRFFRNRFEQLLLDCSYDGRGAGDGSSVGLPELCEELAFDAEPFPRHYDRDLRRLCGHEASTWFCTERSYGDVARLLRRVIEARRAGNTRPRGQWVGEVLSCANLINGMRDIHPAYSREQIDDQH